MAYLFMETNHWLECSSTYTVKLALTQSLMFARLSTSFSDCNLSISVRQSRDWRPSGPV